MSERRQYLRTNLTVTVKVWHPAFGEGIYKIRDVSDGGLFLVIDPETCGISMGDHLEVQVQGLPVPAPIKETKVVRQAKDGFGLEFV